MNFDLSDEQAQFEKQLRTWFAQRYDFAERRSIIASPTGASEAHWSELAGLGALGAAFSVGQGGYGGPVEMMILMMAAGRALCVEPLIETLAGASVLASLNHPDFAAFVEGHAKPLLLEAGQGFSSIVPAVRCMSLATSLLVVTNYSDEVSVRLIDPADRRITITSYRTVDDFTAADVYLGALQDGPVIATGERARTAVDLAKDMATLAVATQGLGVIEELYRQTLEYARQRRQFGRIIGSFQVLQHRIVEMMIATEQCRSIVMFAALKLDGPTDARRHAVSAAKAFVGRALRNVSQEAIQIHGGIGIADETPVSHYFRRATMMEQQCGSTALHLKRFGDCSIRA